MIPNPTRADHRKKRKLNKTMASSKRKKKRDRLSSNSDTDFTLGPDEFMKEVLDQSGYEGLIKQIEGSKMKADDKKTMKSAVKALEEENDWIVTENKHLTEKIKMLQEELIRVKAEKFDQFMIAKPTTSYSSIVNKTPEKDTPKANSDNVIIIKETKQNNIGTCQTKAMDEIRELQKKGKKMKISKVIKTKTGLLVQTPDDPKEIIKDLKTLESLKSDHTEVYESTKMSPTIILNRVSNDTDSTTIVSTLCSMNEELTGLETHMRFLFEMKNNNKSTKDIVMRVTPTVYTKMKKMQRLFTHTEAITFRERIFVKQCQRCYRFNPGHKTSECQERLCGVCGVKGEHTCSGVKKCVNCTNHPNSNFHQHTQHSPNSTQCPMYEMQFQRLQSRIRYVPESDDPGLPPVRVQKK